MGEFFYYLYVNKPQKIDMKTVYNILCILFGIGMVVFGLNKFYNFIPMPEMSPEQIALFEAFGKIGWLMPLVALAEIAGGFLSIFPKTRTVGALILLPVIVGILAHHTHHDPAGLPIAIAFGAIDLWILVQNRKKLAKLF